MRLSCLNGCCCDLLFYSLALYVFYSALYTDEQKNFPQYDLVLAALLAFFWLAASSAWGHGLSGIKSVANLDWVTGWWLWSVVVWW